MSVFHYTFSESLLKMLRSDYLIISKNVKWYSILPAWKWNIVSKKFLIIEIINPMIRNDNSISKDIINKLKIDIRNVLDIEYSEHEKAEAAIQSIIRYYLYNKIPMYRIIKNALDNYFILVRNSFEDYVKSGIAYAMLNITAYYSEEECLSVINNEERKNKLTIVAEYNMED